MGLTGYTSFTLTGSSNNWSAPGCTRYSDSSGRQDTNWKVFTGYWLTYNQVYPYELWGGESCFGVTSRFELHTDAAGCSNFYWECGGSGSGVYWAVTTSTSKPSSGTAATYSSGKFKGSTSSAQMLPNSTYYLWIWNSHSTCRMGDSNTLTVSGSGTYGRPGTITAKVNGTDITATDMGSTIALSFAADTAGASYVGGYSFRDSGGTTRTRPLFASQSASTFSWTPQTTEFCGTSSNYITDEKSVEVTVSVEVFYGSVSAGTSTKKITLNFPTADAGIRAANRWMALTLAQPTAASGFAVYIQGWSTASLTLDPTKLSWPTGISGELGKWTVKIGTRAAVEVAANMTSYTSAAIAESGTVTVIVTAVDRRGFTVQFTEDITVYPYAEPEGNMSYFRADSGGDPDRLGTYIAITPDITIAGINGLNTISITLAAVPRDNSGSISFANLTNKAVNIRGNNLGDKTYDLTLTATDGLGRSLELKGLLTSANWLIKGRADGNGIAFGKYPEYANTFQIAEGWGMLHGENRIPEIIDGTDGTTAGADTELEPNRTYLLITGNDTAAALNGLFLIRTGGAAGLAVKLAGAADVTVTVTNTTVNNETISTATVTTASGTCGCFFLRIA